MKKRILSLLTALCLMLTLAPAALAVDVEDVSVDDQIVVEVPETDAADPTEEPEVAPIEEAPAEKVPAGEPAEETTAEKPAMPSVYALDGDSSAQVELLAQDGTSKGQCDLNEACRTAIGSDTIKLLSDIVVTPTAFRDGMYAGIGVGCSLDLNGHTLTINNDNNISAGYIFGIVAMYETDYSGTIQNGKVVLNFSATDNTLTYGIFAGGEKGLTIKNIEIVTTENNTATGGVLFNFAGSFADGYEQKIENSVIDVGGSAISALSPELNYTTFKVVSGSYKNLYSGNSLPADVATQEGSSAMTTNPDGVAEGTTVVTSTDTTAMIVENGNAYLYDTLQDAVDAVENGRGSDGDTPATITLLKDTEEKVTLKTDTKFNILPADGITNSATYKTEDGYEVKTDPETGTVSVAPIAVNRRDPDPLHIGAHCGRRNGRSDGCRSTGNRHSECHLEQQRRECGDCKQRRCHRCRGGYCHNYRGFHRGWRENRHMRRDCQGCGLSRHT